MNKEEMICKNCKYHYIEEISFDYPQSCCSKRQITTEEWLKCNDFEYDDKYIEQLQRENKQLKEVIDKAIKNEEEIMYLTNKVAITTQNVEIKAVRDRLEEIFDILKEVE